MLGTIVNLALEGCGKTHEKYVTERTLDAHLS